MTRSRVVSMSVGETSVRAPHDRLQFQELVHETGPLIIDFLVVCPN